MLNKRMNRREFLWTLLLIGLTVIGLGFLARHIGAQSTRNSATVAKPGVNGVNSSNYGR